MVKEGWAEVRVGTISNHRAGRRSRERADCLYDCDQSPRRWVVAVGRWASAALRTRDSHPPEGPPPVGRRRRAEVGWTAGGERGLCENARFKFVSDSQVQSMNERIPSVNLGPLYPIQSSSVLR